MREAQLSELASHLRLACMRIARRVRFEGSEEIAQHHYSVMTQLESGPRTARQLADRDRVSPPVMTRNVNWLEQMGYVHRSPDPDDGRQMMIALTTEGWAKLTQVKANRDAWMLSRIRTLTEREHEVLAEASVILERIERI